MHEYSPVILDSCIFLKPLNNDLTTNIGAWTPVVAREGVSDYFLLLIFVNVREFLRKSTKNVKGIR